MTIAEAETTFERADVVLIDLDDADDGVAAAHRIAEFHGSIVATISSEDMHQDGLTHFQKPLDAAAIALLLDRVGAAQQSI